MYHLSESGKVEVNPASGLVIKRWKGNEEWLMEVRRKHGNPRSFVYFIHNFQNGLSKIGRSVNPGIREKTLASMEPYLSTVALCVTPNSEVSERDFHYIFQEDRIRGEWFALSPRAVDILLDCFKKYGTLETHEPTLKRLRGVYCEPEYFI